MTPPPASTRRRIAAALVDLGVLAALFTAIAARDRLLRFTGGRLTCDLHRWHALAFVAIAIGYYLASELAFDATPGKLLFHLRVASASGEPASIGQIVGRNLSRLVDALPAFYLVGALLLLFTRQHLRVGDLLAHTRVQEAPAPRGRPPDQRR